MAVQSVTSGAGTPPAGTDNVPGTCLLYTTMDRAALLDASLRRIAELTVPDEILVVDDGGSDDTERVCGQAREHLGLPVSYARVDHPGDTSCCRARNYGIRHGTRREVVITSEPEMWFETDAVAQLTALHRTDPGRVISAGTIRHERAPGLGEYETIVGWVAPFVALYRRDWLLGIGGWDEDFAGWGWEDTDLLTRLRLTGVGQRIEPEVAARHSWHPPRWAQGQALNEALFRSKDFNLGPNELTTANRGREWGEP